MTYYDVYVGYLEDPDFSFDKADRRSNGNIPNRVGPDFPGDFDLMMHVVGKIRTGVWDGKQTDWGGWVAKLKGSEIRSFVYELLEPASRLRQRIKSSDEEMRTFVESLDPDKTYALVACES